MINKNPIYQLDHDDLIKYISSIIDERIILENDKEIIDAILIMCMNDIDYRLTDKLCSKYFYNRDYYVKRMSIMAVGHIARVYGKLVNKELYEQIVCIYLDKSSQYCELASDALDDIQTFLKIPKPQKR